MEANKSFFLGLELTQTSSKNNSKQNQLPTDKNNYFKKDVQNLEKVILQSFKYCQAKNAKNKFIKRKRLDQVKKYQKQLITLIKKKSEQVIQDLINHSEKMIQQQQLSLNCSEEIQNQTLNKLKKSIQSLKYGEQSKEQKRFDLQKMKRMTLQCQQELQKMEGKFADLSKQLQSQIADQIEKPFKKYMKCLNLFKRNLKQMTQVDSWE